MVSQWILFTCMKLYKYTTHICNNVFDIARKGLKMRLTYMVLFRFGCSI